ncbi:IclR family transcriptional regulator [Microbacterium sp. bgisy207]|uniref:IclR family transcriptional regulator n=1 Tax=Microbacterium sp. bgisy207 TaxID=3413800 RepID=UPI003EB6B3A5
MSVSMQSDKYQLGSVDRSLEILSILAATPRLRLAELSAQLQANPSTVLRALRVLERHGLVRRASSELEYVLGARLVELGQAAVASIDIVQELRSPLRSLSADFNATAHLGMVREGMVTVLEKIDPPRPIVGYSAVGSRMPLHATAVGKAALALGGTGLLPANSGLHSYTVHTITDTAELATDLAQTVQRRYSVEREEYHNGFGCVGSAVRIGSDIYAVSISGSLTSEDELRVRGETLRNFVHDVTGSYQGAAQNL